MGVEGVDPEWFGPGLAPPPSRSQPSANPLDAPSLRKPGPASLVVPETVRSGGTIVFADGDVTVVGNVSSGAEVIAGGSIHIYGALRGRAVAGASGNPQARIFCRRFEAELLVIDGLYKCADDMDPGLRGKAVQARLDRKAMIITTLD
jgi:septum site-determining protein MinC